MSKQQEIDRYLATGDYDELFGEWNGDILSRAMHGSDELLDALVVEVHRRASGRPVPAEVPNLDLVAFTRGKVEPMVRGLFPRREQEQVLEVLQRSVVFLTPTNVEEVIRATDWLPSAWDIANLYIGSLGGELLGEEAPRIVGMSEETTCYVSLSYFKHQEQDHFADFLVHEAAHIFHNCKRRRVGLPFTRRREWLLEIAFVKRETFAYACEAYSRILELSSSRTERARLLAEHEDGALPGDERVDAAEYIDILREAVSARNGWKRILARCAPPRLSSLRRRS